jgi:hypothetical protein
MTTYTVHEPPPREEGVAPDPERFVFVRDGFYFWAFLLSPLWMLRHRLWLVLVAYVVLVGGLDVGLALAGASRSVTLGINVVVALLIGFEAASLYRLTLNRRGWRNVGVVVGDSLEEAERRFFDAWVRQGPSSAGPEIVPPAPSAPTRRPLAGNDIVGLFPTPGASR